MFCRHCCLPGWFLVTATEICNVNCARSLDSSLRFRHWPLARLAHPQIADLLQQYRERSRKVLGVLLKDLDLAQLAQLVHDHSDGHAGLVGTFCAAIAIQNKPPHPCLTTLAAIRQFAALGLTDWLVKRPAYK